MTGDSKGVSRALVDTLFGVLYSPLIPPLFFTSFCARADPSLGYPSSASPVPLPRCGRIGLGAARSPRGVP